MKGIIFFIILCVAIIGIDKIRSDRYLKKPKNIILFIGDGMGVAQVYAAITMSSSQLFIENFPYSGFSKTYSTDNYITDSAAGGTAIASGVKTDNGMIGVRPDSTAIQSIMEIAKKNGLATGLISTTAITHATPASFVAHNPNRNDYEGIARDFMNNTIDVFIGGGLNHFKKRRDGVDLTQMLELNYYDVVYSLGEMKSSGSDKLAALLAPVDMPSDSAGRGDMLKDATLKAIEILSRNKKGFILMVEGSLIDKGGHDNKLNYNISELIDMDEAVGAALDFAKTNKRTTVVVTADHETGGLTLTGGDITGHQVKALYGTRDHTAIMVPVFSFGPDSEKFSGIHENTFFFDEFIDMLKLNI